MNTSTMSRRVVFHFFSLLVCFILLSVHSSLLAQESSKYKGLLWEISGNGLKKPSYLYGTMHVSNKIAFHLTDSFFIAIKNCNVVALEINPETLVQDLMKTPGYSGSMTWSGEAFSDFYVKAFASSTADNKVIAKVLSKEHSFANYLLYRSRGRQENFEENTYLDLFIFQAGKKLNKQVCGLEDVAYTQDLSIQASIYEDEDEKPEVAFSRSEVFENIQDAYRKGDLDALDSLNKLLSSKKYIELMLYHRNVLMADKMDSILRRNTLFTGVGAAHLPGEMGMIELLRKKGYTVRPVSNVQKKSDQMKDKIEASVCKINCSDKVAEDSMFRVALPGDMISEVKNIHNAKEKTNILVKEYFFPDMANGVYYSVTRINTFAPLHGLSQEFFMKRIDSLLYENIPGKIISKKIISFNGFPGYDIVNKTRKGDVQRYQILVTPMEIFVFKLAGVGEYVGKEGDKFFSSIRMSNTFTPAWSSFAPAGGGFTVSMPGAMTVQNNSEMNRGSAPEYLVQSIDRTGNYFFFMKTNYHDLSYIEEDTFELNVLSRNFYKELKYQPYEQKMMQVKGNPALHLLLQKDQKKNLQLRVIIAGPNYYLAGVKTEDLAVAETFFNSLQLKSSVYDAPFETVKDTSLMFSVVTNVKPDAEGAYREMYETLRDKQQKKDNSHMSFHRYSKFVSPATAEVIHVQLMKFHSYKSFKNPDEFWEKRLKAITSHESLIVHKKEMKNDREMNLILTDTNSTRSVKIRMILKDGVIYTIGANIDTVNGESQFVKSFFESFTPVDTVIGRSVFENKGDLFFQAMDSKDSTKMAQALSSLDIIRFEDKHAAGFIKLLKNFDFSKVSDNPQTEKENILRELGLVKDKNLIPFLKEMYAQSTDTFSYQVGILKTLARQKTPESYKTIVELLQTDIPLANESDIRVLFREIKDSLKMSVHLYPGMLEFTRYPEYKRSIYELLAILSDSNYIKPAAYQTYKNIIIRDAREEVKRRYSSGKGSSYRSYNSYEYEYEGNSYDKKSSINDILYAYAILLMPYYDEPSVSYFFDRIKKVKNDELLLESSLLLLKNKKQVDDTIWTRFTKDISKRLELYNRLKDMKRLDKFDSSYLTQESIAQAMLYKNYFNKDKDTTVFLEKRKVVVQGKPGYIYYFKRREKDAKIWKMDYIAFHAKDSMEIQNEYIAKERGAKYNPNDLQTMMDATVEATEMKGRRRAMGRYSYEYYEEDYYEYED